MIKNPIIDLIQALLLFGPKKEFSHETIGEKFYAVNKARSSYWAILFFGIMSMVPIGALAEVLVKGKNLSVEFFISFFIIVIIAGIAFRKFLWHVRGKEHLEIDQTTLHIYKTGTFFTKDKVYPLQRLSNVRRREEKGLENINPYIADKVKKQRVIQRIMFRLTIGEIVITFQKDTSYLKEIIYLFNYLSDEERQLVINEINSRIEKVKSHE